MMSVAAVAANTTNGSENSVGELMGDLRKHYIRLITLLTSAFATVLSISMVRIAAPYIQEAFHLRYADLTWIHNAYQISYAILLPVFGQLGDRYGRRKMLLYGLGLFGAGSILCGLSWGLPSMILFRMIQGVGAAATFPNALVLATGQFPKEHQGRAMGIWAMGVSLGTVTGPTLGGALIQFLGWRSVFFINVPVVVISLMCIRYVVPDEETDGEIDAAFDYVGTIVLAVMIISLVTGMVNGPDLGWTNLTVMALLAVMLVSLPVFYHVEHQHDNPLIQPALFHNRVFLTGVLCGGAHLVAMQGINFLMPLFLSQVHQLHALNIGLLMLPQAAVRFVVSPLAGNLADRFGNRFPVTLGLAIRTSSLVYMAFLAPQSTPLIIAGALVLDGSGAALIWAPSLNASIQSCPEDMAGSAAGVFNMLRFVMGVVGTVMMGVVLDMLFISVPDVGPVPGFMHAYLILAVITGIGLTQVKHLQPSTSEMHTDSQ